MRRLLARRGIRAIIPRRSDQRPDDRRHSPFDRVAYRERNRVERMVNRFKQYRRVATRYEKRGALPRDGAADGGAALAVALLDYGGRG